jgi:UDP-N-acetyl-2-amino-2-deoxyglucuronate dehydrogenase
MRPVALCDIRPEKAAALARQMGCEGLPVYTDYQTMLDETRPELVAVATPSHSHAAIGMEVLRRGMALIVEKPMALSSQDARRLCEMSRKTGVPVAVCHQNRFNPAVEALDDALSAGALGRIYYGAAALRWQRGADYYAQADWRGRWTTDGGVLMNQGIHAAELLVHLLGRPAKIGGLIARHGRPLEAEDWAGALITFESGATAVLECTGLMEPQNLEETLLLSGSKGVARLGGVALNRIELPGQAAAGSPVADVYGEGHGRLYRDMLRAMRESGQPKVPAEQGRLAVELVLAVYRSALMGGAAVDFMAADFSTEQMAGYGFG